jgi:hypothetical protein
MISGFLNQWRRFISSENVFPVTLIVVYCVLLLVQLNQPPLQRYPGWDPVWMDAMHVGKLQAVRESLRVGEFPYINPYQEFGWNNLGDTTLPQTPWFFLHFLVLFLSPVTVIVIKQLLMLILAGLGVYYYLRRVINDRILSLMGAALYVSLPLFITFLYHSILNVLCCIPLALLLIHNLLENCGRKELLLWSLLSFFIVSSGNIFLFIILPPAVLIYAFVVGYYYHRLGFKKVMISITWLIGLLFLSSAVFVLPFLENIHQISQGKEIISVLGVGFSPLTMREFVDFINLYCTQTIFKPNEGSGVFMYLPLFFWAASVLAIMLRPLIADEKRGLLKIVIALFLCALAMPLIGLMFYATPKLAALGHGTLRYQFNLIPIMGLLAGIISFNCINSIPLLKVRIYLTIASASLIYEGLLLVIPYPPTDGLTWFDIKHTASTAIPCSNLVSVRFMADMYPVLVISNLLVLLAIFSYGIIANRTSTKLKYVLMTSIPFLILLNISIHNELRASQQSGWQQLGRSDYHINSYKALQDFLNKTVGRADPNYRILPASADVFRCGRGRNWKFQELLEMNVGDHRKVLFSYRETMHPYASFIYSRINGKNQTSNWFPPLSESVPANISMLNLAGVKWVLSADTKIDHSDFLFRGQYVAPKCPFYETAADGEVFLYELRNTLSITFLVDQYELMTATESVTKIHEGKRPWLESVVYLEENPSLPIVDHQPAPQGMALISHETFNSIKIDVNTSKDRFLVLSYVHRPGWRAHLENGDRLKIFRAYGGFMTVLVPAGEHSVTMRYVSKSVYAGLAIALLSFIGPLFLFSRIRKI